jgi:hypothetical protein
MSLCFSAQRLDTQGASFNFTHAALSVCVVFLKYLVTSHTSYLLTQFSNFSAGGCTLTMENTTIDTLL